MPKRNSLNRRRLRDATNVGAIFAMTTTSMATPTHEIDQHEGDRSGIRRDRETRRTADGECVGPRHPGRCGQPDPLHFLLLAELLALRTIVLNLNFALATSGPPTAEAMRALIDRADAEKFEQGDGPHRQTRTGRRSNKAIGKSRSAAPTSRPDDPWFPRQLARDRHLEMGSTT